MAKILVVLALTLTVGGHWILLQSAAWAGMLISYSKDSTLSEALLKTFDGNHPCKLCQMVQAGKRSERPHEIVKFETKFDYWLTTTAPLLVPPPPIVILSSPCRPFRLLFDRPPTPPPRTA